MTEANTGQDATQNSTTHSAITQIQMSNESTMKFSTVLCFNSWIEIIPEPLGELSQNKGGGSSKGKNLTKFVLVGYGPVSSILSSKIVVCISIQAANHLACLVPKGQY